MLQDAQLELIQALYASIALSKLNTDITRERDDKLTLKCRKIEYFKPLFRNLSFMQEIKEHTSDVKQLEKQIEMLSYGNA